MKWLQKLIKRKLIAGDPDCKVIIRITFCAGFYRATADYDSWSRYTVYGCFTYEACFYQLMNCIKAERGTSIMDHDFQINFYNQSYIKEIGQ